jgi:hypothetical protein
VKTDHVVSCAMAAAKGNPEFEALCKELATDVIPKLEEAATQRFIKSHLPISLLPPNLLDTCKVKFINVYSFKILPFLLN